MNAPMQYRTLPRTGERMSVIGLGMAYIDEAPEAEIEETIRLAVARGVNVFDLCGSTSKAIPAYGRALRPARERVFVQHHFGAVYPRGEYGWSRDLAAVKKEHAARMKALGFDYADFGFLHCTDEPDDLDALRASGVCTYCNHCKPCPRGIDVGMANRYYDLSLAGDPLAAGHYGKLARHASDCVACGHCERRCPFHVAQIDRMRRIAAHFGK